MNLREAIVTYKRTPDTTQRRIGDSRDAAAIARKLIPDGAVEHFVVIGLDAKHRAVTWQTIGIGSIVACPVDPTAVFRFAVLSGCPAMLIAHNHPSGEPTPSAEDIALTERLRQGAKLLGVTILDHIVLGFDSDYFSFLDAGMLAR